MGSGLTSRPLTGLALGGVAAFSCLGAAMLIANEGSGIGVAVTLGVLLAIVCFLWPEIGLYVLLLSMLLSPEIIAGGLSGGSTTVSRGVTLRLDDFLLLLIAVTWIARGAVYKDLNLVARSPINRGVLFYLLAAAVSTAIGMLFDRVRFPVGPLFVVKYVEYVVVYYAMINYVQDKEHLRRLVWMAFLTAVLVALYGVLQIPRGVRVSAPFEGLNGEPNTMGGYLLFMMALLGGLLVYSPTLKDARRYIFGLAVLGVPFLFTLSRSSYLGLVGAGPLLVLFSRRKAIAAFSLVVMLLTMALLAPQPVVERIQYTLGGQGTVPGQIQVGGLRLDTSTSARIEATSKIVDDFQQEPIFGFGVTGYGFVDGQYQRVLIEMGIIGLVAFLWLIATLFRQGWEALHAVDGWWEKGLCAGYLAGLAGLCLHSLGANSFIIVRIMEPFWFFTGVVALLLRFSSGGDREPTPARDVGRWSRGLVSPIPYGR